MCRNMSARYQHIGQIIPEPIQLLMSALPQLETAISYITCVSCKMQTLQVVVQQKFSDCIT